MQIRRAETGDTQGILKLLSEVNDVHAKLRPDIFIPGLRKYTEEELEEILTDEERPIFVAELEGEIAGYAFCVRTESTGSNNTKPLRELYLDDLCVEEKYRGRKIADRLFEAVKEEAERTDCGFVTLNVWSGNRSAERFYQRMGMKPRKTMMEYSLKEAKQ